MQLSIYFTIPTLKWKTQTRDTNCSELQSSLKYIALCIAPRLFIRKCHAIEMMHWWSILKSFAKSSNISSLFRLFVWEEKFLKASCVPTPTHALRSLDL